MSGLLSEVPLIPTTLPRVSPFPPATHLRSWPLSSEETSSMWTWSHSWNKEHGLHSSITILAFRESVYVQGGIQKIQIRF